MPEGHVDAETLAEFREDLLPRRAAATVSAHLAHCGQCAELDAQLAGVTAALASAPVPPMPAALTQRITAALAAEAAKAQREAGAADTHAGTVTGAAAPSDGASRPRAPAPAARHRRRARPRAGLSRPSGLGLRLAATAAVITVVVGGAYGVTRLVGQGQSGSSGAGSASQSRQAPTFANGAAAPLGGTQGSGTGALTITHSGTKYQLSQLKDQASTVLARYAPGIAGNGATKTAPAANPADRGFSGLLACVARVTRGQVPKLVDVATYRGQPAAVIMVPVPGTRIIRVWVVGTGCSGPGDDVLARTAVESTP